MKSRGCGLEGEVFEGPWGDGGPGVSPSRQRSQGRCWMRRALTDVKDEGRPRVCLCLAFPSESLGISYPGRLPNLANITLNVELLAYLLDHYLYRICVTTCRSLVYAATHQGPIQTADRDVVGSLVRLLLPYHHHLHSYYYSRSLCLPLFTLTQKYPSPSS